MQARREAVIITKRGKPVAQFGPVQQIDDPTFGFMKGTIC